MTGKKQAGHDADTRKTSNAREPDLGMNPGCGRVESRVELPVKGRLKGRVLAAPSWVIPGTLAENCRFLSGKVDEVGLLFLEQDACLAYGKDDLPQSLADLCLGFHVHLPSDLDWSHPALAAENCLRLMDKVDFLNAGLAVLHPPLALPRAAVRSQAPLFVPGNANFPCAASVQVPVQAPASSAAADAGRALEVFLSTWQRSGRKAADIALENIRGCDLLAHSGFIIETGVNICLDIGHIFAYNQSDLSTNHALLARTRLFHLSAPGAGKFKSRHLPLSRLAAKERELVLQLVATAPDDAVMMPELFNWADYSASARLLAQWLGTT